jgi:hypothetical protein
VTSLLTVGQVSDRTGLTKREIHARIRYGQIPAECADGQLVVRASWVDEYTGVTR